MVSKEKKMSADLKALVVQLADAKQQRERDSASRKAQLAVCVTRNQLQCTNKLLITKTET